MRAALIFSGYRSPPRRREIIVQVVQRGHLGGDFQISAGAWNYLCRALRDAPGIRFREVRD